MSISFVTLFHDENISRLLNNNVKYSIYFSKIVVIINLCNSYFK